MDSKTMRQAIKDKYSSVPEKQVETGVYIKSIGIKYVTLINTWGTTNTEQHTISDFYNNHVR